MSTPSWSHDGKWLYFQSGASQTSTTKIFRCPINGGDAIAVSQESGAYPVESYDRETVYFVKNGRASTINAVPLKSEGAVTAVKGMPAVSDQSLWTVVPGRWLLYTQVDKAISDIMLVENFR